jgi:hypothetical protein
MTSPVRADRDLCANALCSSSEIALMLRVVVEAVCILQCYAGISGHANRHPAAAIIGIAASPLLRLHPEQKAVPVGGTPLYRSNILSKRNSLKMARG